MKVIDLLNKIANGEEVPKKIKFNEYEYTYHDKEHDYCRPGYDCTYICFETDFVIFRILNDKVEIIEEDKKIEKLKQRKKIEGSLEGQTYYSWKYDVEDIGNKINELIDEVNKLKENK